MEIPESDGCISEMMYAAMCEAVRKDPIVGEGSCTVIDECYEENDLIALFRRHNCVSTTDAVEAAKAVSGTFEDVYDDLTAESQREMAREAAAELYG